ncbi:unnamed protein product [Sphacelaria rigidula]
MFCGVGEIVWEKASSIVRTKGSSIGRVRMAAAGVRSSGAGLETIVFDSPIPTEGRLESWVRDLDRQLISSLVRDVNFVVEALVAHGQVMGGGAVARGGGGGGGVGGSDKSESTKISTSPSRSNSTPSRDDGNPKQGTHGDGGGREDGAASATSEGLPGGGPCIQAHLLARSVHWTGLVEAALRQKPPVKNRKVTTVGSSNKGGTDVALQIIYASLLAHVDGWAGELRLPGVMRPITATSNAALITQALQQRDTVRELLEACSPTPSSSSEIPAEVGQAERMHG